MTDVVYGYLLVCLAALGAGAINSLAGGGTLLTFPALLAVLGPGSEVMANVTSTVALVPGSLAGAWGYRREMREIRPWIRLLVWPSLVGGLVGSLLLVLVRGEVFAALVPWLLLAASVLFLVQPLLSRAARLGNKPPSPAVQACLVFFQLLVAVYGGYFGAGIGVLMLASLGLMGIGDIHRLNALKTLLAFWINGISVVVFVLRSTVHWPFAVSMAVAAIVGGYLGASLGRRLNKQVVRWIVIAVGFGMALYFFAARP
jgi:uncharacterized membrane protein YfcA